MEKNKITSSLYLLSGIIFILASIIGKNIVYIPIGILFITLGISYNKKNDSKK